MRSVVKRADRTMISDAVGTLQSHALRRCWSDEVKAQIVAEFYARGSVVSEVAGGTRSRRSIFRAGARLPALVC
jgi:transposase-like protein